MKFVTVVTAITRAIALAAFSLALGSCAQPADNSADNSEEPQTTY